MMKDLEIPVGIESEGFTTNIDGDLHPIPYSIRPDGSLQTDPYPLLDSHVVPEILDVCIEDITDPQSTIQLLEREYRNREISLFQILNKLDLKIIKSGSHPTGVEHVQNITPIARYQTICSRNGVYSKQLICSIHATFNTRNAASAMNVTERVYGWLPLYLALSANSPFSEGIDTGVMQCRMVKWQRLFRAGFPSNPEILSSVDNWHTYLRNVVMPVTGTQTIPDAIKNVWYYIRPKGVKGDLVEFRMFDNHHSVRHIMSLVALAQAHIGYIESTPSLENPLKYVEYLIEGTQSAIAQGIDGHMFDPRNWELITIREGVTRFLDMLEETFHKLGTMEYFDYLTLVSQNPYQYIGSYQQLAVYRQTGNMEAVNKFLVDQTEAEILAKV